MPLPNACAEAELRLRQSGRFTPHAREEALPSLPAREAEAFEGF